MSIDNTMENICRTCLRAAEKLIPLQNQSDLLQKIATITSTELILNEGWPNCICQECITNVKKCYNFRMVILTSNKDLADRAKAAKISKTKSLAKPLNTVNNELLIKNEDTETPVEHITIAVESNDSCLESDNESNSPDGLPEIQVDYQICDNKKSDTEEAESNTGPFKSELERAIALMKIFPCKLCNQTFPSRFKLSNHRRTEHYSKSICSICGAIIRSDNIRRHIQMHSEGPVECKICGKVCKNSESLRGHSLIHRGEIYTCDICGKTSRLKAEYKRHLKVHEDPEIGKQVCNLCGKKVRDLRKHMLSHTGERPYPCKFCKKGFTSPYALKVHTRQHTNERPYMCDYCSMAFPQKVSLVTHIKSKHQIKTEFG